MKPNAFMGLLAIAIFFVAAVPAHAVLVQTTVTGTVDVAEATNPFGLSVGDTATAVAVYDDALVDPADPAFVLAIDSDPAFSLTIDFNTFTFTENLDSDFGSGFPFLTFNLGDISGIDFEISEWVFGGFTALEFGSFAAGTRFFLDDLDPNAPTVVLLEGTWDLENSVTVPFSSQVPEPHTVLLFSAGLIGLRYAKKRRTNRTNSVVFSE